MRNERDNRENKIDDLKNGTIEAEEMTREQTQEQAREQTREQWMEIVRAIGDKQDRLSEAQDRLVNEQNRLSGGQKEMKEQLRQLWWEVDVKRWEEKDGSFQKGLGLGLILAPLVWAAVAVLLEGFRLFAYRFG